jgi:hypothetical protein
MRIAAGTRAWDRVRDVAAIVRKSMDMVNVVTKEKSKKTKNAPGSRRRFVMK